MKEVVVVQVSELLELAEDNGYGKALCPYDVEDFDELGCFDITREEVLEDLNSIPDDPWSKACLKLLNEENENFFFLVK
jgi:hypothetical protein